MPIKILSPQVVNQISAGEVIERPSSVVKELIENSLDAGATRIDIEIENGGSHLICVRDNGCGISKAELSIALANHATSKITSFEDLVDITSLGFRGEALASIKSVSRLIITSRTIEQREGWQNYFDVQNMETVLKPIAHPVGTSLEVFDLFYNIPARRKFMRSKNTEFLHIYTIIRRFALARFDVSFSLKHNGKIIRQYKAIQNQETYKNRLQTTCGITFTNNSFKINYKKNNLILKGWISKPIKLKRQFICFQYFYVNGRIIHNRMINHAIRKAYQMYSENIKNIAYVLYLELSPHQIDVNVHPTKHEVRFHQLRLIHDFIYQGIINTFRNNINIEKLSMISDIPPKEVCYKTYPKLIKDKNFLAPDILINTIEKNSHYKKNINSQNISCPQNIIPVIEDLYNNCIISTSEFLKPQIEKSNTYLIYQLKGIGRVLSILFKRYALLEYDDTLQLLSLSVASKYIKQVQFTSGNKELKIKTLVIPIRIKIAEDKLFIINKEANLLKKVGIDLQRDENYAILYTIPLQLREKNLQVFIQELLDVLMENHEISISSLIKWLVYRDDEDNYWNYNQAIILLTELCRICPNVFCSPPSDLIQVIDIQYTINSLEYEKIRSR